MRIAIDTALTAAAIGAQAVQIACFLERIGQIHNCADRIELSLITVLCDIDQAWWQRSGVEPI